MQKSNKKESLLKIVGISGKLGSGKTELFKVLKNIEKCFDGPLYKISFADPLKEEVYEKLLKPKGFKLEDLYNENKKHFRLILQGVGTDFYRQLIDDLYWIKEFEKKLESLESNSIVIVDDCRFINEYEFLKSKRALLIRIERNTEPWYKSLFKSKKEHASEKDLDKKSFDYTIYNNSDLDSYHRKIVGLFFNMGWLDFETKKNNVKELQNTSK